MPTQQQNPDKVEGQEQTFAYTRSGSGYWPVISGFRFRGTHKVR